MYERVVIIFVLEQSYVCEKVYNLLKLLLTCEEIVETLFFPRHIAGSMDVSWFLLTQHYVVHWVTNSRFRSTHLESEIRFARTV